MNVHFSWLCIRIYIKNYFQLHWKCIDDIVNQKSSSDIFGTLFHFISRRMAKQIISVRFVILSILFSAFFLKKAKIFYFFWNRTFINEELLGFYWNFKNFWVYFIKRLYVVLKNKIMHWMCMSGWSGFFFSDLLYCY